MKSCSSLLPALLLVGFGSACGGDEPRAGADREATPATAEAAFDPQRWLEEGLEIQQATFATLSGELRSAMESGGVSEALKYCNVAAYPLTDSLSAAYGVSIRRATRRARNPENRATQRESEVLSAYETTLAEGGELAPVVHEIDESTVAYYAPIRMQPLCLSCHGTVGSDVTPDAAALIAELYPGDQALGYAEGDLRGTWSLSFRR